MCKISFGLLLFCCTIFHQTLAQPFPKPTEVETELTRLDSLFWVGYNECNLRAFESFFTEDVEFYHDKSGPVYSRDSLLHVIATGLCGNPEWHLRREVVPGTVRIFHMDNFGAIMVGEHVFYINEKGKEEYLDGQGDFTHLWKYDNGVWKIGRIYSYNHRPATYDPEKKN